MKEKKKIQDQKRQQKKRRPYHKKGWNHRPMPDWPETKSGEKKVI